MTPSTTDTDVIQLRVDGPGAGPATEDHRVVTIDLVSELSRRFMVADPSDEQAQLDWLCESIGKTVGADVVAIRELDPDDNLTYLVAGWASTPTFLSLLPEGMPVRGEALPEVAVIASDPADMPVGVEPSLLAWWMQKVGWPGTTFPTLFSPLHDGNATNGFISISFAPSDTAPSDTAAGESARPITSDLVGLLASVSAIASQFRERLRMQRVVQRQAEFTALQRYLLTTLATTRSAEALPVLAKASKMIGDYFDAESLALWEFDDSVTLNRRFVWRRGSQRLEFPHGSIPASRAQFGAHQSNQPLRLFKNYSSGSQDPAGEALELWSVPIRDDEVVQGCLVLGLRAGRELTEWEITGLLAVASLLPSVKRRFIAEERLSAALETSPTGMTIRDQDGVLVDCNQAYCDFLGVDDKVWLIGTTLDAVRDPAFPLTQDLTTTNGGSREAAFRHAQGHTVWGRVRSRRVAGMQEVLRVTHIEDITKDLAERESLAHKANFDALTGLPNRHGLSDIVAEFMAPGPTAGDADAAVLLIDLNGFKEVNDRFGHQAGDHVLQQVSHRLEGAIRSSDRAIRYGGDEFVVLLDGPLTPAAAFSVAVGLHAAFAEPVQLASIDGHQAIEVSLSIGICLVHGDLSAQLEKAIGHADAAMYRAKDRGRHQTEMHRK